ncbi:MAG TPA: polysaccharide biosynthesis tyrosine autokinase [Caulobacteraceae bacterium]
MSVPQGADDDLRRQPNLPARLPQGVQARQPLQLAPPGWEMSRPGESDGEPHRDLVDYWRTLLKHRWMILASIVACLAVGAAVTLLTRPIYTAQSTLQIDREAAKVVSAGEVTSSDNLVEGEEFFQTQYGLLRSRALAIRVAEALGLTHSDAFIRQMGANPRKPANVTAEARSNIQRDQVMGLLRTNLGVLPNRGSRLVGVAFSSPDPALSARVANAFAENFIASALDRRYESSSYARDFLERRLAEVKAKLEDSERQLVAYAASQQIITLNEAGQANNPGAQQSLAAANLEALDNALSTAKATRIQAEARWREAQATPGMGLPEILQSPTVQQISQERAKLMAEYQDKLSVFKPDYPDMRQLKAQIDETDRQLALEATNIRGSLRVQYQAALGGERALQGQVEGLKGAVLDLSKRNIQYTILQREVDTNRTLYDGLLQRYKEVGVAGGVTTNNISVVDRAEAPLKPSKPKPLLNMLIASLGGIVLGVVAALLAEALDQAIRTPADVESKLGVPLLGTVPVLKTGIQPAEALADTRSPLSEAYYSLRSALQFSTKDGFPKTLLVTSARPGEGKSTTAFAIAQNVARLGFRTLLIDADLRNPSLHKVVGIDNRTGVSNILTGSAVLKDVVQSGGLLNLFAAPCGPLPPSPAELLAGSRLKMLITEAAALFDIVIVDGPPVMGLADAPMISAVLAGSLLVIEAGRTGRAQARAALRRLAMANGHVLGAVLTKFNARQASYGYGYGYEYDYDYGKSPSKLAQPKAGLTALLDRTKRRRAGG